MEYLMQKYEVFYDMILLIRTPYSFVNVLRNGKK
jgi:hypothetical protein